MKVIYTGVFLEESIPGRLQKTIVTQHVTHVFRPASINRSFFKKRVIADVVGYACDGKNEGYLVKLRAEDPELQAELERSIKTPHITISVSIDGKPVDTGKLNFSPVDGGGSYTGIYGAFCDDGCVHVMTEGVLV